MAARRKLAFFALGAVAACATGEAALPSGGDARPHGDAAVATDGAPADGGPRVARGPGEVLTSKNDNGRTGANLGETVLDRSRVKDLGRVATLAVDGELYAQPLVAADVATDRGARSLVVAATMNDTLFAFDIDTAEEVWRASVGRPGRSQRNVNGPNGILSTPAIDRGRDLVYVVGRDCTEEKTSFDRCGVPTEVQRCDERLSVIDLRTGVVTKSVVIRGSVAGPSGPLRFDPSVQWNRPGLLLAGDALFVAFGSGPNANDHEEDFAYHGWVFRYDVRGLDAPPAIFNTTPRTAGGSVWQAGAGPAADDDHVYFTSANDIVGCATHAPSGFPAKPADAEDSVVRLPRAFASATLASPTSSDVPHGSVATYGEAKTYTDTRPYTAGGITGTIFQFTSSGDNGFGSSAPTLVPGARDLVVGTKGGILYVLDRDTMAPRQAPISPFDLQPLQGDHTLYIHSWWGLPVIPGALVFHRIGADEGRVYGWAMGDRLRSFRYDYRAHTLVPDRVAPTRPSVTGGNLSLSADGARADTAILWATTVDPDSAAKGRIVAFDAATLEELWSDTLPTYAKFTPPTIARGRVLAPSARAGETTAIVVYGVAP